MKQITIFFIFFISSSTAQGNLQFNQIISIANGANLTVPINKAWRIDAINFSETLSFSIGSMNNTSCATLTSTIPNNRECYYIGNLLSIGGVYFQTPYLSYTTLATTCNSSCPATNPYILSTSSSSPLSFKFPIWLEAGKSISVIQGVGILISVVEFNIIP